MTRRLKGLAFICSAGLLFPVILPAQTDTGKRPASGTGPSGQGEPAAVIVFFTDKDIAGREGLEAALEARTRQLSDRALRRRAKMGLHAATYQDLPVSARYVGEVQRLGGRLRHTLNWLNAASFEMTKAQSEECARLVFVERIKPLARRKRNQSPDEGLPTTTPALSAPAKSLLNYGPSFRQNQMIGASVCHDSGYTGAGTLVAMLDNGFRKSHQAFDSLLAAGRLVDEWDFVSGSDTVAWAGHGTGTWSLAGAFVPGQLVGPAYGASWVIYHTEDNNLEMPVEEDHWAAALQRSDSIGADIVSSSLAYRDFDDPSLSYSYEDLDGNTAISTLAARHAASLGIIVCNAMANSGPDIGSLAAPADADSILSVGATDSMGIIASYSSRGPTYDGRPKPEVCAQGTQTWWASWSTASSYGRATGTSCATPLVAGACALVLEAHPEWTPLQVRQALMMTASRALTPDSSTYGWGVIDAWAAIHYDQSGVAAGGPIEVEGKGLNPTCRPNPVRTLATVSFEMPRPGPARLAVYDAAGRLVFDRREHCLPSGANSFAWDGRDHNGRPVPGGIYFFRVSGAGQSAVAKAAMLR